MKLNYEETLYDISEIYSYRDMTGWDLTQHLNMDALVIYATNFSHEIPDSDVFPKDMMGTTFIKCNLSNCKIPDGNLLIDCNTTRFKVQNDLRDWEVDENNIPFKVLNEKHEIMMGRSVDLLDIPLQKLNSIDEIKKVGG